MTAEAPLPLFSELCNAIKVRRVPALTGDSGAKASPLSSPHSPPLVLGFPGGLAAAYPCTLLACCALTRTLPSLPAQVPPLRVRPADIRALQAFFLRSIAKQRDVPDIFLTDEAVRALESYSYPLNITELQTMVERAVAQVGGLGGCRGERREETAAAHGGW